MKKFRLIMIALVCCISAASAQNLEWRMMNSRISAFAQRPGSPDVVFAGDEAGLIRRSEDRGATWKLVSMVSEAGISSIRFLNANTGFAGTFEGGLILMTTDGGNTWTRKQLVDPSASPFSVRFPGAARIIIADDKTAFFDVFNHPISGPSRKETIVTRDAGASFRLDTAPGEIYHVANGTMIALGRETGDFGLAKFTVYKSTDMGLSWNIVKTSPAGLNNDFNFHGINLAFFLSENEFFITGNRNLGSDRKIYKTTDGGNSFTPLNFPETKADYIYFKNSSEGIAIVNGGIASKTTSYTTDGGLSWTQVEKGVETAALFLGNDTFIAYRNGHTAISTDFGKTWTEQADPINWTKSSGGIPGYHFLQVINDSVAVVSIAKLSGGVGSGGELMKTTDGGLSWHLIKDAEGKKFVGDEFHFIDADTFFYTGSGYNDQGQGGYLKIKYSTDGGLTAKDVFTGSYWEDIAEIIFIDANNAMTYSGNSNKVNYSSDGGQSWAAHIPPTPLGQILNISAPAVNAWYALTGGTKIYKSTDQGRNWTDVTGSANCGGRIHFINENTGFLFGCREKIFKTTDGGQSWADLGSGISPDIDNNQNTWMEFQNETTGYMLTNNANGARAISKTTDGGNTWTWYKGSQVNSPNMARLDFRDENTGAMIDAFGNFARYIGPATFTTDTVQLSTGPVSVSEHDSYQYISIYPNPAGDHILVRAGNETINSVEIIDLMGKSLFSQAGEAASVYKIDTGNIPAGLYFVRVHTERGVFTQRLNIVR